MLALDKYIAKNAIFKITSKQNLEFTPKEEGII